ncbi:hypothetical protein KEU06_08850 [Pseudaminobacter sp. 19-2017]|uniref:Uncharacterized protein n=1 Tax=Pseudaminobacter soli (ex Zhang et al. 2022) TaxID=2831468 RepID=A0A942DWW1_9HYPH|nr:hypothetical protein [Pseudaminobacter soli]MBS3648736.1 hypothetical protein [Pseudaminobacter soli]
MTGLEIVGASALYLVGLYVVSMLLTWFTIFLNRKGDGLSALIFGGVMFYFMFGSGIVVGLVLLGMALVG